MWYNSDLTEAYGDAYIEFLEDTARLDGPRE